MKILYNNDVIGSLQGVKSLAGVVVFVAASFPEETDFVLDESKVSCMPENLHDDRALMGWSEMPRSSESIVKRWLIKKLIAVGDSKQIAAAEMFRGVSPYTASMMERDKRRHDKALAGGFAKAENEAIIKANADFWAALDQYLELIEMGRKAVSKIIDTGDFERANTIIGKFETLGKDTTKQALLGLLKA